MKVAPPSSSSSGVLPCTVPTARSGVPCRDTCSKPELPWGSGATSLWLAVTCGAERRLLSTKALYGVSLGGMAALRGCAAWQGGMDGWGLGHQSGWCVELWVCTNLQAGLLGQQQGVHQGHLLLPASSQHARDHGGRQEAAGILQGGPWGAEPAAGGAVSPCPSLSRPSPHLPATSRPFFLFPPPLCPLGARGAPCSPHLVCRAAGCPAPAWPPRAAPSPAPWPGRSRAWFGVRRLCSEPARSPARRRRRKRRSGMGDGNPQVSPKGPTSILPRGTPRHGASPLLSPAHRGLTTPASPLPVAMSTICMAISFPQRLCASRVLAPRCGQQMTLGWFTSSRSLGGSCRHSPGPASAPRSFWGCRDWVGGVLDGVGLFRGPI